MIVSTQIQEAGYTKSSPILKDIQFSLQAGELVGLIGPNGSGKSSTIKALLGVLEHVEGTIELEDYAYIPERPIFYDGLTLREHLHFLGTTLEVDEEKFNDDAEMLLKEFDLEKVAHHYPESYSKGMQQKAMIMFAFLQKRSLYIIDEPFMGLDPKIIRKLLTMIEEEKKRGATILMSTHVLDTAEKICDRFLLLSNGRLIAEGTIDDIRQKSRLPDGSLFDCFDVLTERDNDAG